MFLPQSTFLGFDPNPNYSNLFTDVLGGKFVKATVSGKNEKITTRELKEGGLGQYAPVVDKQAQSAAELIETYHGSDKIIDFLSVDVEGAEYSIFERLIKDKIYQNVCQINVELHPVWYHFTGYSYFDVVKIFRNLFIDGTFLWVDSTLNPPQQWPSFFINVKNEECIEKYLKNRLL
uniref:Methyltransferase FkbM domain-containing protein n=1 Tax=Panagrolaimus davidi TaxID=227884 RepID=A0A914QG11_9BILA